MKYSIDDENDEKKRRENEELRKQINEEFGGVHWSNPDSDLPPDIENEFLSHIMAFEKSYRDAKKIIVYKFLGEPEYKEVDELTDPEVSIELERLYKVMAENQLKLETLNKVSDRELYRFITKELFWEVKDDIRIPGMLSYYTYEEFHPNHDDDIRLHLDMFLLSYIDKEDEYYKRLLTKEAEKLTWHQDFRNTFDSFQKINYDVTQVDFDLEKKKAQVLFTCKIEATVADSEDVFLYEGEGKADLSYESESWLTDTFEFPKPTLK